MISMLLYRRSRKCWCVHPPHRTRWSRSPSLAWWIPIRGTIKAANIPCIDGLPLAALLTDRLGRPVIIGNDADCFALAEAVLGAGKSHRIVFGAILGTGVGGGLVIDGRLVTGRGGYAGEWGHAPVAATRVGTPPVELPRFACGCGLHGCVNTLGGARGMERLHAHLGGPPNQ